MRFGTYSGGEMIDFSMRFGTYSGGEMIDFSMRFSREALRDISM
jgi:hypothetical protein